MLGWLLEAWESWARAVLFCFVLGFSLTKDVHHTQAGFNIPVVLLGKSLLLDAGFF